MQRLTLIILSIMIFSCATRENEQIQIKRDVEEVALSFFIDSLLYRKGLFDWENPAFESESMNLNLHLGMSDDSWHSEGILAGMDIYTDGTICSVTNPSYTDAFDKEATPFLKDYEFKSEYEPRSYDVPSKLKKLSWEDFCKLKDNNMYFLCLKYNISDQNHSIVDLELIDSTFDSGYIFTFLIDSQNVVNLTISLHSYLDGYDRCETKLIEE